MTDNRTTVVETIQDPNDPANRIATGKFFITGSCDLEGAQETALHRLDMQFALLISLGRNYNGKNFQIDDASRASINGAASVAMIAQGAGQPFSLNWIASDNSTVTLDANGMIAFGVNVGQYYAALVLTNRSLKDMIAGLTDIPSCDAFDVTQGWPAN